MKSEEKYDFDEFFIFIIVTRDDLMGGERIFCSNYIMADKHLRS